MWVSEWGFKGELDLIVYNGFLRFVFIYRSLSKWLTVNVKIWFMNRGARIGLDFKWEQKLIDIVCLSHPLPLSIPILSCLVCLSVCLSVRADIGLINNAVFGIMNANCYHNENYEYRKIMKNKTKKKISFSFLFYISSMPLSTHI